MMEGRFVNYSSNSDEDTELTQFRDSRNEEEPFLPEHSQLQLEGIEYLSTLNRAIRNFEKNKNISNATDFIKAVKKLRDDLKADTQSQIDAGKSEFEISESPAANIAKQTEILLKNMQSQFKTELKLNAISKFENNCKQTSGWKAFGNTIKTVIFAGVGMVVGAGIGAGIGYAIGAWSGPGALVTAAIGLAKGTVTGATAGLAASTAFGGIAAFTISGCLFFKRTPLERDVSFVSKTGENFLRVNEQIKREHKKEVETAAAAKQVRRGR